MKSFARKSFVRGQKVIDTKSWQFAIMTASYEIFLEMIPLDSSKAVQIKFKEVLTMRNKIFVTRADFHFDLQRFADDLNYIDANGI